jgi:hypothetical protein
MSALTLTFVDVSRLTLTLGSVDVSGLLTLMLGSVDVNPFRLSLTVESVTLVMESVDIRADSHLLFRGHQG